MNPQDIRMKVSAADQGAAQPTKFLGNSRMSFSCRSYSPQMLGTLAAAGARFGRCRHCGRRTRIMRLRCRKPARRKNCLPWRACATTRHRRSSSWDRTGGNDDAVPVDPGKAATLLDVAAPASSRTSGSPSTQPDPMHLKNLVLRAWWDGESAPSVEVPIGDFFGLGLGEYFVYQSALLAWRPIKALNAYFQMPFDTPPNHPHQRRQSPHQQPLFRHRLHHLPPSRQPRPLPRAISPGRALQEIRPTPASTRISTANDNYIFLEATAADILSA